MSQTDFGPATGSASLFLSYPTGTTASVEFHGPIGANSLGPDDAPIVETTSSYTGTVVRTLAAGVQFTLPA